MKFIHLADLHIGKKVNGFSMIDEQIHILEQIINYLKSESIDVVLIAGDIYDKNTPPIEAITVFEDFLTKVTSLNIKVLIISGNHDSIERLSFASALMESEGVYIAKQFNGDVKKVVLEDEFGVVNFYMLPFIRPVDVKKIFESESICDYNEALKKVISTININKNERNIILSHQFITNADTSESEINSVGGLDNVDACNYKDFDYSALGHIHKPQAISENIRYSGSILKYSFSECNINKSVTVVEIKEKGDINITTLPLKPIHDLIEIKGLYNDIMTPGFYNEIDVNSYVRVILTNDSIEPDAINKLRTVYPNIMRVDYENVTTLNHEKIHENEKQFTQTPIELINSFYNEVYGKEMTIKQNEYLKSIIEEIWG